MLEFVEGSVVRFTLLEIRTLEVLSGGFVDVGCRMNQIMVSLRFAISGDLFTHFTLRGFLVAGAQILAIADLFAGSDIGRVQFEFLPVNCCRLPSALSCTVD